MIREPWKWLSDDQRDTWQEEYDRVEEMGMLDDPDIAMPHEIVDPARWNNLVARIRALEANQ